MAELDAQTAALHRLLTDAHAGPQAKVDALVALTMRTVFVVPWPNDAPGYRTLVNSEGVAALPVFTTRACLEGAARRFGWLSPDGSVAAREVGARAAFNHSMQQQLQYVVIDIADDHALEVTREEFEPLLTPAARRESTGPYAAAGKISSTMMRAVNSTPPAPVGDRAMRATPVPGSLEAPRAPRIEPPRSTPGLELGGPSAHAAPPAAAPRPAGAALPADPALGFAPPGAAPDALYDALAEALRGYPEVEWAALALHGGALAAALRVDPGYRARIDEIAAEAKRAAAPHGAVEVRLLDDPSTARAARSRGVVFYPWRKK